MQIPGAELLCTTKADGGLITLRKHTLKYLGVRVILSAAHSYVVLCVYVCGVGGAGERGKRMRGRGNAVVMLRSAESG